MRYVISGAEYRVCESREIKYKDLEYVENMETAIIIVQDNISSDFGYDSWREFLDHEDPLITGDRFNYSISHSNSIQKVSYRVEILKEETEDLDYKPYQTRWYRRLKSA